jgi:hypothetical protein
VFALDGDRDNANYRAEGEPDLMIDVAVTDYHTHLRLSVSHLLERTDEPRYMDAVLSESAARVLHGLLGDALGLPSLSWGSDGVLHREGE